MSQNTTTEQELLEKYIAIAYEKQLHFGDIIGENNWNVDVRQGTISFGNDLVFPMQILGTYSHAGETWLWGWANEQSNLPESVLQHGQQLKQYGEQNGIDLLRNSEFDAEKSDLHIIGSIASGMFGADAYYLADYGQGTLLVTVQHPSISGSRTHNHLRTFTVFPAVISQYEVDHKQALKHYLTAKGYTVSEEGQTLTGKHGTDTVAVSFDELGRLSAMNGENMTL